MHIWEVYRTLRRRCQSVFSQWASTVWTYWDPFQAYLNGRKASFGHAAEGRRGVQVEWPVFAYCDGYLANRKGITAHRRLMSLIMEVNGKQGELQLLQSYLHCRRTGSGGLRILAGHSRKRRWRARIEVVDVTASLNRISTCVTLFDCGGRHGCCQNCAVTSERLSALSSIDNIFHCPKTWAQKCLVVGTLLVSDR